ncbi:MAG: ABC transporter substrate-binding protein [Pseudomonadota bacterium]
MSRSIGMSRVFQAGVCLIASLLLPACDRGSRTSHAEAVEGDTPQRIVSLDLCADQFALKFVPPARILAVSPDAVKDFSYMREAAAGVLVVRPIAEDVLLLKPDLVVRAYGGGPNAAAYFERLGIPVVEVGWANDIDSVLTNIERIATALGSAAEGRRVVAEARERLDAIAAKGSGNAALYMTPAGVTTGPGSLIHEMLVAAGLQNFQEQPGWNPVPLERLAYEQPDLVAAAFFETLTNHPDAWSAARHPVARAQLRQPSTVPIKGAWTACTSWSILDAIEALAEESAAP